MITALFVFLAASFFGGLTQIPRIPMDRPAGGLAGSLGIAVCMGVARPHDRKEIAARPFSLMMGFVEYLRAETLISVIMIAFGILVPAGETSVAQGREIKPSVGVSMSVLSRDTAAPVRKFRIILLCKTLQERARGLQGFRKLERDEAALFSFDPPQAATFWMASVAFPVDIVFVDADGAVVKVQRNCAPGSRDQYASGLPVRWVIESAAGSGINAGDRIVFDPGR